MEGELKAARTPRISIVIVAWNALHFLRPCLRSLDQPAPFSDIEIFVVDNGSTDGSADAVAAEFPAVRLIRETENRGYPAANNIALRTILAEGRSDFVILLNSDTIVLDRTVDLLADYLAGHPGVAAVLPALVLPDGRFQVGPCGYLPTARALFGYFFGLNKIFPVTSRSFFIDQKAVSRRVPFLPVEWLSGACLALRRETIERIGLMSEDYFFYAEDLDWGRRMKDAGLVLHYWPGARVVHHHGVTYQDIIGKTNTAWLRMLFQYMKKERGRSEYLLGRSFAVLGFLFRTVGRVVLSFPWAAKASRRKIRDAFRFFTFSLTGV